jgi:hypothetical protein
MIEDVSKFNVLTSELEKQQRMETCNSCENNIELHSGNLCNACACPINYVVAYKFKICPLEKWTVNE